MVAKEQWLVRLESRKDFLGRLRLWNINNGFVVTYAIWAVIAVVVYRAIVA